MSLMRDLGRATALVVAALFAFVPVPLLASGFQLVEQNASGLGVAYAGQAASVKDASAIYFNPAALTNVEGTQILVAVSGLGLSSTFSDSRSTAPYFPNGVPLPVATGSDGGDAGGWSAVPNAYVSWQAAPRLWLGVGVNAPFGLATKWQPDWLGRFHSVTSDVKSINLNPTVAVKVNDRLSLGAGVDYQQLKATLSQNVAYGGIAYGSAASAAGSGGAAWVLSQIGGPAGLALEGESTIKGDTWTWGFNVGAQVRVGDASKLGISYRSKIKHELTGDVTFANAPTFSTAPPLGAIGSALNAAFASGGVKTTMDLPDTLSIAASTERDKVEFMADWTWTGWSSVQSLDILRDDDTELTDQPLKFQDTWRAGAGLAYRLNDVWKLRGGLAYDKTPVQDEYRTPRLPDGDRVWAAVGAEWTMGKGAVDVGYAHLFVGAASSNLPNQSSASEPMRGDLIGSYEDKVDVVSIQYRVSF
jgi:long-chain fatty acid transport protein